MPVRTGPILPARARAVIVQGMTTIDSQALDETIATSFKALRKAIDTHSEKSIELYSLALRALVPLRQQLIDERVRSLPQPR